MLKKIVFLLTLALLVACSPSGGQSSAGSTSEKIGASQAMGLASQGDPWAEGIVGTGLLLRRLDGVKRVLMIGAHPDDEDTALLAALSRRYGVETAYLSLTRGEGGQNLIGPELDEGLGLVRTGELLAARALDGGRQYFTRAFDFGYSKTAEETFGFWPREELLEDVTWVVRTFRPQIIVSVFSGTSRDGHGQHQAAGIMAHDVFDVAGDPTRYPDQLKAGATAWTPSKLYLLTRRNPQDATVRVETGAFDPLLGRSHFQVAMDSRSQHRSQDMGAAQPMGPRASSVALVNSRVTSDGPDEIFSGVDTSLVALAGKLPAGAHSEDTMAGVKLALETYREAIGDAAQALEIMEPWATAPHLGKAVTSLKEALKLLGQDTGSVGNGGDISELERSLRERIPLAQEALLRGAGVVVDVRVDGDLVVPGEIVDGRIQLWNGGPFPLHEVTPLLILPEGWRSLDGLETGRDVPAGSLSEWAFRVRIPEDAGASKAYFLARARAGEMYVWPQDRGLWATAANPDLIFGQLSLQVGDLGGLEVFKPARFRGVDKATGEYLKPVQVVPALSVTVDPQVMVWPEESVEAREFTVTLQKQGGDALDGTVQMDVPDGWSVEPGSYPFSVIEPGAEASFVFSVRRPIGSTRGQFGVTARVTADDGREYGEGVSLVDYSHIRRSALFPPARSRVSVFPVELAPNLRVGYVMGSGDGGVEAVRQMGAEVELLDSDALRSGSFQGFDVVVLGIRAYETRPDLVAANDRLLEFARGGGTVIAQYNKYEFARGGFAPYDVGMSRPHDRVADETARVRLLDPDHPALRFPNRIEEGDFDGWVQEKGLYFLADWSSEFTPLLEMADPGEGAKQGGLLVAPVGDGLYVYTGLAFFRQFPEGVPGAYRLFANLLSLSSEGLE